MSKIFSGVLIGILLLGFGSMYCKTRAQDRLLGELRSSNLENLENIEWLRNNLPDYSTTFLKFDGRMLTLVDRVDELQVAIQNIYIPVEGSYNVTVNLDSTKLVEYNQLIFEYMSQLENLTPEQADSVQGIMLNLLYSLVTPEVSTTTNGFTVSPHLGVSSNFSQGLDVAVGTRLYYYDRLGLGLEFAHPTTGGWNPALGVYGDIRDFIPGLRNLAFGVGVRRYFGENSTKFNAGIRIYL